MDRRIERLENHVPEDRRADDMTDDELAAIATGGKVTRAEALTDADLEAIAAGQDAPDASGHPTQPPAE